MHERSHADTTKFTGILSCNECGKVISRLRRLQAHELLHRTRLDWRHVCAWCGLRFPHLQSCHQHERSHTAPPRIRPSIACSWCPRTFQVRSSALLHERSHTELLQCDVCIKGFTCQRDLRQHRVGHTSATETMADKFFSDVAELAQRSTLPADSSAQLLEANWGHLEVSLQTLHSGGPLDSVVSKPSASCHNEGCDDVTPHGEQSGAVLQLPLSTTPPMEALSTPQPPPFRTLTSIPEPKSPKTGGPRRSRVSACAWCYERLPPSLLAAHERSHTAPLALACRLCKATFKDRASVSLHIAKAHMQVLTLQ